MDPSGELIYLPSYSIVGYCWTTSGIFWPSLFPICNSPSSPSLFRIALRLDILSSKTLSSNSASSESQHCHHLGFLVTPKHVYFLLSSRFVAADFKAKGKNTDSGRCRCKWTYVVSTKKLLQTAVTHLSDFSNRFDCYYYHYTFVKHWTMIGFLFFKPLKIKKEKLECNLMRLLKVLIQLQLVFFFLNNRKVIWKELDFSPSDEFRFMVKD